MKSLRPGLPLVERDVSVGFQLMALTLEKLRHDSGDMM